jgi:16S rRNA (uracil1498-N3)-methyltransferase
MARLRDRFFIEGVHGAGATVVFAADDARKIAVVLRAKSGECVQVIDSAGAAYEASLTVDGSEVRATLTVPIERGTRELGARVTIAQAIPKGQKMELIVEKATELGATAIVPVRSARVAGEHTGANKIERWKRVAKTAAAQCGRAVVPTIGPVTDWADLLASFGAYDRVYVPWELADVRPLRATLDREAPGAAKVLFVIGPEGGFSADEVDAAVAAGAQTLSLGSRILRTETVALVVLAAFAYARGEL